MLEMNIDMLKETWKDIEGFDGVCQISNLGRVKSVKREFLSNSFSQKHIAEKYNISQSTVCKINRRKTWMHL